MSSIFDVVRSRVSAADAYARYVGPVQRNKALCVWHDDHHPSLSFKDKFCHCFACGEGGSAIDLTMKIFNLDVKGAAAKLNADFGLGLDMNAPLPAHAVRRAQPQRGPLDVVMEVIKALPCPGTVDDFANVLNEAFRATQPQEGDLADLHPDADLDFEGNLLDTYQPEDYSDAGCAAVFSRFAVGRLIWTDSRGWLAWVGPVWAANEHAAVGQGIGFTHLMLEESQDLLARAQATRVSAQSAGGDGLEEAKVKERAADRYLSFALKERARQRIEALLALSKPSLYVADDALDSDPFALNTPTGIIDLRTGETRPHNPAAYCTAITAVSPSDQGDELWRNHLLTITDDDPDLMRFHQEAAGMALVGRVYCENLLIALGGGRNGKSTHFNVQLMVLGPGYAGMINPEVLTTDKRNAGADLATLKGKRLIIAGELEEGKRLSTSVLKRLTSTDPISAERKYYAPETFTPTHSMVLYTNHLPRLGSMDNGTKRRIKVVPFDAVIPADAERKNYTQFLFENAGGAILSWMLEGARMFISNGFQLSPCSAVEDATGQYFEQNDWLRQFLDECCIVEPGRKCGGGALYKAYSTRASEDGEYVRRNNDFATELERAGFTREKKKVGAVWYGLELRANWQIGGGYSAQSGLG